MLQFVYFGVLLVTPDVFCENKKQADLDSYFIN